VRPEGLDKLKKFDDLIGSQTHDLPACSIVPQPNASHVPSTAGVVSYSVEEEEEEERENENDIIYAFS
jgi:hypothetical protein